VQADCSLAGHPHIFVLGDMAYAQQNGQALPGTAQVAVQQGAFLGRVLTAQVCGKTPESAFVYRHRGDMATIGKRLAVADLGRIHLRGRSAWLTWLGLHLMQLINFENRLLVLIQWAWAYVRWNRGASLVTGTDPDRHTPVAPRS
jgi:NADH:ubiquinone reductase (H+-translocating)